MRCLFCGKELALLKRLTGGEFCSDAHRRQYQQEYNQLALSRLLQANEPPAGDKPELRPFVEEPILPLDEVEEPTPAPVAVVEAPAEPKVMAAPVIAAAAPVAQEAPPKPDAPTQPEHFIEPALAPVWRPTIAMATLTRSEGQSAEAAQWTPLLPDRPRYASFAAQTQLASAGRITLTGEVEMQDSAHRLTERGIELREFARAVPDMRLQFFPLALEGTNERTELSRTRLDFPMEVVIAGALPPAAAKLWRAEAREFAAAVAVLGGWGEIDFATTGFEVVPSAVVTPGLKETVEVSIEVPAAQPEVVQPAELPVRPAMETLVAVKLPPLRPDAAMPLTVVVPAPLWSQAPEIPRLEGLPLRPLMILEPAAAAVAPEAPAKAAEPASNRSAGKTRRPEVRILNPVKSAVAPATLAAKPTEVAPVSVAKAQVAPTEMHKSETVQPVKAPTSPPAAKVSLLVTSAPTAPRSASDLGLPSLRVEPASPGGPSALTKKIAAGIAAVVVLALAAYFMLGNGSGTTITAAASAGTPSAKGDWIENFASDSTGQRHIALLRASQKFSDYRLEFDGQVESKALAWVFRAHDANNFYGAKIEEQQIGGVVTRMAVRYAMVNGVEQSRKQIPLTTSGPAGAPYKIRLQAKGNQFAFFIQGKLVDEWTDGRFATGGAGILSGDGERGRLSSSFNLVPLGGKD